MQVYAETFSVRMTEKRVENLNLVLNYYGLTKGTRSERFRLLVDQLALRVPIKKDVPQKLKSLLVQTFSNDTKVGTKLECRQLGAV